MVPEVVMGPPVRPAPVPMLVKATEIEVSCGLSTRPLFAVPLRQSLTAWVTSTRMYWYLPLGYGTEMGFMLSGVPAGVLAFGVLYIRVPSTQPVGEVTSTTSNPPPTVTALTYNLTVAF